MKLGMAQLVLLVSIINHKNYKKRILFKILIINKKLKQFTISIFLVLAGSLLEHAESLLDKGIHPTKIADGFDLACKKALEKLDSIAEKFPITDREALIKSAMTSLGSKMYIDNNFI